MTDKYMKTCSKPPLRKMQIKSTMRYQYMPRIAKIKKNNTIKSDKDVKQLKLSYIAGGSIKKFDENCFIIKQGGNYLCN